MKISALAITGLCVAVGCGGSSGSPAGSGGNGPPTPPSSAETREAAPAAATPPATSDLLASSPLAGPFASIDEFCAQLEQGAKCGARAAFAVTSIPPPYVGVEIFTTLDRDSGLEYCEVAVQLERGWFATSQHQVCSMEQPQSEGEVTAVSFANRTAGAPIAMVVAHIEGRTDHETTEEDTLVLCGVDASGAPGCITPIVTYRYATDRHGAEHETELSVTVLENGTIELSGDGDGSVVGVFPAPF